MMDWTWEQQLDSDWEAAWDLSQMEDDEPEQPDWDAINDDKKLMEAGLL